MGLGGIQHNRKKSPLDPGIRESLFMITSGGIHGTEEIAGAPRLVAFRKLVVMDRDIKHLTIALRRMEVRTKQNHQMMR